MNRTELKELYESGRLDSVQRLRNLRGAIQEHTGLTVPRRPADVEEWWNSKKSVFARNLNEDETEDDNETSDQT